MVSIYTNLDSKYNTDICLLGDIHYSSNFNLKVFDKIIKNININRPKYICIVGDTIDYTEIEDINEIDKLYEFISTLSKIAKVIISLGNHDYTSIKNKDKEYKYPKKFIKNIKKIDNVILLDNEIYVDGDIRFIGYTESFEAYYNERCNGNIVINELNDLLKDIDNKKYNILLSHNPLHLTLDSVYNNIKNYKKLDLILSGHTHNGMIPNFIKTNNMLITPSKKWFKKDGRGHMVKGMVDIIVTGGITKLSERAGVFHLFNFIYKSNIDYIKVGGKAKKQIKS